MSWRRKQTAIYWPFVPSDHTSTYFSFCWAAQPGVNEGRKPSVCKMILTLASYLQLELQLELELQLQLELNSLKPSVAPGYIFVWRKSAACGRTHLHRIQPRLQVKVIFWYLRPDSPVSWLTARSRVNILQEESQAIWDFFKFLKRKIDLELRTWNTLKQIRECRLTDYQKRRLRRVLINGKLL